ncbi:hypothetical protein [Paracoccus sp. (in: a-proteobacteria)]|uniref:hypothetical protein n=1 Tax=Paracoccus sp. TaxID=267 RepID=UPI003A8B7817
MSRCLIVLLSAVVLTGCARTPERQALDDFNDTVGTANRTISNVRLIRSLVR